MQETSYSKRDKQDLIVGLILFRLTLDFMYLFIIQGEYENITILSLGYARGAFSFNYDAGKIIASFLLSILFIAFLVKFIIERDRPHELLCVGLLNISVLPSVVLFAYSDISWEFILLFTLFWLWFYVIVMLINRKIEKSNDNSRCKKNRVGLISKRSAVILFWLITLIFIIGSISLSFNYFGGFNISLSYAPDDVYGSRVAARGAFGTLSNYFRNNAMYIVIPLIANAFLIKRMYSLFSVALLVLLLLFSIDSQKAVLMLALLSFVIVHMNNNRILGKLIRCFLLINIFVILFYLVTENILFIDYLVKRIYFLPAIIGKCYFEYVSTHGNMILFSTLLQVANIIKDYPYAEKALPFLIGKTYFGSINISANTGGFAAAFAYGFLSLFVTPIVYGFLFRLLNKVTDKMEEKYYMPFIVVTVFVVNGTTIPSVILVYGYLTGLMLLYVMNSAGVFEFSGENLIKFSFGGKKKI